MDLIRKIRLFFKKKDRYVLHWSDTFKAWQVYRVNTFSKPFFLSYHSPSYFCGFAITDETDLVKLNENELRLGGKLYTK